MSETANKKWLTEDDGTKIVPRTLISCVQDEDGNTLQESVDNMLVIEPEETTEIPEDITSVVTSQDIHNIVSDVYDNTKTYSVGDYCIKDNMLYKCNTEITEAEEFDSSKWDATTCGSEFNSLNSKLPQFATNVVVHTVTTTEAGESVIRITPQGFQSGAKYIMINGITGDGNGTNNRMLDYIYNQVSGALIIYGLIAGENLNIAYVAIM